MAELPRAAWAVYITGADGEFRASLAGPVWAHLPQTPQAAEYASTVAAIQTLEFPTQIVGDCLGVVNATLRLMQDKVPRGMHAGLMKDSAEGDTLHLIKEALWMPSHQELKADATNEERILHEGNDAVDKLAGKTRLEEEYRTGAAELEDASTMCKFTGQILRALGTVLSLWPALPRAMERKILERADTLKVTHTWEFSTHHNYWRCTTCGVFSHDSVQNGPPKKYGRCRPGRILEKYSKALDLGHDVNLVIVHGVPTHYCRDCGARGSWQWRKLLSKCRGHPSSSGEQKWLKHALDGGAQLNVPSFPRQRKTGAAPPKARKRRATAKEREQEPKDVMALRNAAHASREDRRRWELMDNGCCQQVCFPCLPLFQERPPAPEPPPLQVGHAPPEPRHHGSLRPAPASDDEEMADEEACPACQATVLPSDDRCFQCGLPRPTASSGQQAIAPDLISTPSLDADRAFATTTPSNQEAGSESKTPGTVRETRMATSRQNGSQHVPSQSVVNSCRKISHPKPDQQDGEGTVGAAAGPRVWWHGGTLVPPPYLEAPAPPPRKRAKLGRRPCTTRRASLSPSLNANPARQAKTAGAEPAGRRGRKRKARQTDHKGAAATAARTAADESLPAGPGPPPTRRRLL